MSGCSPGRTWFWRWRSNPLRRRDDIVEAWIVLAVWTVIAVGGTVAGLVTAHAAEVTFAQQRAERRTVRAVLLSDVPNPAGAGRSSGDKVQAPVRWTAPDGSLRTGRTLIGTGREAGTGVVVWQDSRGALTTAPPSPGDAAVEAGFLGALAGLALTGAVHGVGAVARWRLEQRRIARWGREWEAVGPTWGHRTA